MVDKSTKILMRLPCTTPSSPTATCLTMLGVGTLAKTMSAWSATSWGFFAALAPCFTNASTAAGTGSQIVTVKPAASKRCTIGAPMRPTPTKPSEGLVITYSPSADKFGRFKCQSVAFWKAIPIRTIVASSNGLPNNCIPSGIPLSANPAGKEIPAVPM